MTLLQFQGCESVSSSRDLGVTKLPKRQKATLSAILPPPPIPFLVFFSHVNRFSLWVLSLIPRQVLGHIESTFRNHVIPLERCCNVPHLQSQSMIPPPQGSLVSDSTFCQLLRIRYCVRFFKWASSSLLCKVSFVHRQLSSCERCERHRVPARHTMHDWLACGQTIEESSVSTSDPFEVGFSTNSMISLPGCSHEHPDQVAYSLYPLAS